MITGLNHITLSVDDLQISWNFYKDILGFKPLMKTRKIAYLLAGDLWFCLDEDPAVRPAPLAEYSHIAFSVSKNHFQEIAQRIKMSQARLWKENESEGESLYFFDPNGHKLELHDGDWKSRCRTTIAQQGTTSTSHIATSMESDQLDLDVGARQRSSRLNQNFSICASCFA